MKDTTDLTAIAKVIYQQFPATQGWDGDPYAFHEPGADAHRERALRAAAAVAETLNTHDPGDQRVPDNAHTAVAALSEVLTRAWDAGHAAEAGDMTARDGTIHSLIGVWHAARTLTNPSTCPIRAVVLNHADGSIVGRFDETYGVALGDDRPFPWTALRGPLLLLWHPEDSITAS